MLRQTEGQFSTPDGVHVRAFLPESRVVTDEEYDNYRLVILLTARAVVNLKNHVKAALASLQQKPAAPSGS